MFKLIEPAFPFRELQNKIGNCYAQLILSVSYSAICLIASSVYN